MAICEFCRKEFKPRPRFKRFCSTPCKNPINRKGNIPWNKGLTKDDPRVLKNCSSSKRVVNCAGWNKGNKSAAAKKAADDASKRMMGVDNPNYNGVCNKQRPAYKQPDGWKLYVREVRKFTAREKRKIVKQTNICFGKYKEDFQLDHVIPIKQGFDENIPSHIIGSNFNLQVLIQEDNRKKWDTTQPKEIVEMIVSSFRKIK